VIFSNRLVEAFMRLFMTVGIRILEAMFAVGALGSAIVLILATVEDLRDIFEKDAVPEHTAFERKAE
jgi:hypothetical protein